MHKQICPKCKSELEYSEQWDARYCPKCEEGELDKGERSMYDAFNQQYVCYFRFVNERRRKA